MAYKIICKQDPINKGLKQFIDDKLEQRKIFKSNIH